MAHEDRKEAPCISPRIWSLETETVAHLAAALHHTRKAAKSSSREVTEHVTINGTMIREQLSLAEHRAGADAAPTTQPEPGPVFEPPRYEWTAGTVYDAEKTLDAAKSLIEAHMDTLTPDQNDQWGTKRATPVRLTISLDLAPVVERINDKRTVEVLDVDVEAS